MADAGFNYRVERRRLELQKLEHEATIEQGEGRLAQIGRQKKVNIARAELANDELDNEARVIETNKSALVRSISDIDKKLTAMVKEPGDG